MLGHGSLSGHGCKTIWSSAGLLWALQVWNSLKYWSANRAGVAAIAGAGDAVEGCVLRGELALALTREFGHVRPGGPPVGE